MVGGQGGTRAVLKLSGLIVAPPISLDQETRQPAADQASPIHLQVHDGRRRTTHCTRAAGGSHRLSRKNGRHTFYLWGVSLRASR